MSDLSLRDTVDGQPLEFQLTLHSQNKSFKLVVRGGPCGCDRWQGGVSGIECVCVWAGGGITDECLVGGEVCLVCVESNAAM